MTAFRSLVLMCWLLSGAVLAQTPGSFVGRNTNPNAPPLAADALNQAFATKADVASPIFTGPASFQGLSQSTTITLAGNTTNNAASSGILATQIFNGTNSVAAGAVLNGITINDHLNWTGSSNGVTGVEILHNYGPGNVGGRTAFWAILNQTAATTDLADNFYVGATFQGIASFNNGGSGLTPTTAKGRMFGANATVHLRSGATNYYQATGMEIDVAVDTGASAMIKSALSIASLGPLNTVQGSVVDAGIWFYKSNGAPLMTAILIGGGGGLNNYPIDPAGSYISDDTSGTTTASTAYGLHFVGAFTTASISVPGFTVDGTGIVTGASYKAGATAGVTCAPGAPTASFSSSGGIVTHC